ncbi:MAG: alpha/beta fold hydrolase [Candidatus Cloacimonetes bacterium]|nr:alpha/beta fold hydrolase [Candidatus Cloacimonadota bacterium]
MSHKDITGRWFAILDVKVAQLKIIFNIEHLDKKLHATMDIPDQHAIAIPMTSVTFENSILRMELAASNISIEGEYKQSEIHGIFKQNGQEFPFILSRTEAEKKHYLRPQEPKEPFPYHSEDVYFENLQDGIKLAGTLSIPEGGRTYPALVFITGSGAQDRDEKVCEHKPFWVIADYLARRGIASLRYDDRGFAKSEGNFASATTYDLARDAASAVAYLKNRPEISGIGLIGHSEGGIIAPMVASQTEDVRFIIMLAGTGKRGDEMLLMQQEAIMRASGAAEEIIQNNLSVNSLVFSFLRRSQDLATSTEEVPSYLENILQEGTYTIPDNLSINSFVSLFANPWFYEFIKLDPVTYLEKVHCPVFALNGSKDTQVPAKANLSAIQAALETAGNNDVTIREYSNLNHLFQECATGLPDEYIQIEQTISPCILEDIAAWLKALN